MLFNNARCRALTPDYVNTASGLELHQFKWLEDESAIGDLPPQWNYLVNEQPRKGSELPANVHFTIGGPHFQEYVNGDFAMEWLQEGTDACIGLEEPMLSRVNTKIAKGQSAK